MSSSDVRDTFDTGGVSVRSTLRRVGGKGPLGPVVGSADRASTWRAVDTTAGPATLRFSATTDGRSLVAEGWGPGAAEAMVSVPGLVGLDDDPGGLVPRDDLVADLTRRFADHRMTRTGTIWEHLVPTIIGQVVTTVGARRSWQGLVAAHGRRPPGPCPEALWLPPTPARLAELGYHDLHRFDIERRRAAVIISCARHAQRLEKCAQLPAAAARRRLEAMSGIGPWTSSWVTQLAHGDPDAVIIGDYNLPALVAWAFARERTADDERMLELLEPYRGQRARVQNLLKMGAPRPPRRGPKLAPATIRHL